MGANDSGATRTERAEPKLPGWIQFLLATLVSLAMGAVGYGELKAEVRALEQRLDRTDQERRDDRASVDKAIDKVGDRLDTMASKLEAIQTDVAQIRARGERNNR